MGEMVTIKIIIRKKKWAMDNKREDKWGHGLKMTYALLVVVVFTVRETEKVNLMVVL